MDAMHRVNQAAPWFKGDRGSGMIDKKPLATAYLLVCDKPFGLQFRCESSYPIFILFPRLATQHRSSPVIPKPPIYAIITDNPLIAEKYESGTIAS